MVKIACGKDAFQNIIHLETSPVEGPSLPQQDKKMRKRKGEKKPEDVSKC